MRLLQRHPQSMQNQTDAKPVRSRPKHRIDTMRLTCGVAAAGLMAMIAIAALLEPNPQGIGTHQGLGFPPCLWVEWLGMRCPSCGMTTSWAWMVRGQPTIAMQTNPAGALLFAQALISIPILIWLTIRGRHRFVRPFEIGSLVAGTLAILIAFAFWIIQLKLG